MEMEDGFNFELYEMIYENCFINRSRYDNGNLQLSLYGLNPETAQTENFVDITLNQNERALRENEIVVDCKSKPTLIPQLKDLGILNTQIGVCNVDNTLYPIYTANFAKVNENEYCMQELIAA